MIKLLVSFCALLVMLALSFSWHVAGIGMNETVTKIGYAVLFLVGVIVFGAIENNFGVDEDDR